MFAVYVVVSLVLTAYLAFSATLDFVLYQQVLIAMARGVSMAIASASAPLVAVAVSTGGQVCSHWWPTEPAVRMRRLPAGGMLPALLARGQVDVPLVQRIARLLARFHGRATTGAGIDEYGSPSVVRANWAENFSQMETFLGRTIQTEINAAIRLAVSRVPDDQQALLASRVAHGCIRDGHGDLHAASICIDGGRITELERENRELRRANEMALSTGERNGLSEFGLPIRGGR